MNIGKVGKGFKGFFLGVFCTLFIGAVVIPQYCDCMGRVETRHLIMNFKSNETIYNIENSLINNRDVLDKKLIINHALAQKINIRNSYINELGEVFIKFGRDGQVLFFKPKIVNKSVRWTCMGGNNKEIGNECLKSFESRSNEKQD